MLLALTLAATLSPIEQASRIEPIGWSADGQRVALRLFYGGEHDEAPECPGYVDGAGKKFRSGLALVVLKANAVEHSFIIQTPASDSECTKPAQAKAALEAAKKKLGELGIDRAATGTVLTVKAERSNADSNEKDEVTTETWTQTWRAFDGDRQVLELSFDVAGTEEAGIGELTFRKGSWKQTLAVGEPKSGSLKRPVVNYSKAAAGSYALEVVALLSPQKDRIVAFFVDRHANMRGSSAGSRLLQLKP